MLATDRTRWDWEYFEEYLGWAFLARHLSSGSSSFRPSIPFFLQFGPE